MFRMDSIIDQHDGVVDNDIDWGKVYLEYTKEYTKRLSQFLQISFNYEEFTSPKEYNFMTDRIFAKISRSDLTKMLKEVRGSVLNNKVKEVFTSCPGFISYYPNHISKWGRISNWDYNQIGAIVEAYVEKANDSFKFDVSDIEADIAIDIHDDGTLENMMLYS